MLHMLAWLAPLFVFGLVVFVHELGHFLAAKGFGVYAPRFSIGFGPALWRWRKKGGETEYKLAALPLGGYVRMASRQDEESAFLEGGGEEGAELPEEYDPNAMVPFGPKPIPEHRWFESKPLHARLVILLAGVTMNLLLGWLLNVGLAATYTHDLTTRVSQVLPNKPAARAGVMAGDSLIAVNGAPIKKWESFFELVGSSTGKPLQVELLRGTEHKTVTLVPITDSVADPATGKKLGKVGMMAGLSDRKLPLGEAIHEGSRATLEMATMVFGALQKIVTRESPVSELGGPIAIAQTSVQAARQGAPVLLYLVALISVNLAVFNLLPVPILDGGQIVLQVVEAVRGRPLNQRAREYVARIGLAFILILFITVTFNDIKRGILAAVGAG